MANASTSRRSFLTLSTAASAAMVLRVVTEPMLARAREHHPPAGSVMIDANENPLGPCTSARTSVIDITPQGGRYLDSLTEDLANTIAAQEGVKAESIHIYAGSTDPLHHAVCAFTSPTRSYVTADPGFEAGMFTSEAIGTRVVKVPLTRAHAHDVKAMLAAAPDAGLFYVCTPNNPTGTLTPLADIEYLIENKPKGSIVLIDEAYIHFSEAASAVDFVKAGKDVVLLRTFSKLYGMAGLRCGFAMARPDLLEKMRAYGGWNFMPVTAMAAGNASLKHSGLVAERRKINAAVREETFQWLDRNGYSYVRSESNCFMLDTKRPAKQVIDAMAAQKIFIGRIWPAWPTYSRITVGTRDEMLQFQDAWKRVMSGSVTARVLHPARPRREGVLPS